MWYVYRKEYYSALTHEITFTGKWMELEIIILSRVTQTQTNVSYLISFVDIIFESLDTCVPFGTPIKNQEISKGS